MPCCALVMESDVPKTHSCSPSTPPFDNLPVELFEVILEMVLPDPSHSAVNTVREHYATLLPLRLVSRRWCTAINGSASLWSLLDCDMDSRLIALAIKHSSTAPVYVTCRRRYYSFRSILDQWEKQLRNFDFARACSAIVGQQCRWRSANLDITAPGGFITALETPMPCLEELEVQCNVDFPTPPWNICGGQAGRLRRIALAGLPARWSSGVFGQLESLTLDRIRHEPPSAMQLVSMLHASPRLKVLKFSVLGTAPPESEIDVPPMAMTSIQSLHVEEVHPLVTQSILKSISRLPSCSKLVVRFKDSRSQSTDAAAFLTTTLGHLIPDIRRIYDTSAPHCTHRPHNSSVKVDWLRFDCSFTEGFALGVPDVLGQSEAILRWLFNVLGQSIIPVKLALHIVVKTSIEPLLNVAARLFSVRLLRLTDPFTAGVPAVLIDDYTSNSILTAIQHLGRPNLVDQIVQWPCPEMVHLVMNIYVNNHKAFSRAILEMVKTRCGLSGSLLETFSDDVEVRLPERFTLVTKDVRIDEPDFRAMVQILGRNAVHVDACASYGLKEEEAAGTRSCNNV